MVAIHRNSKLRASLVDSFTTVLGSGMALAIIVLWFNNPALALTHFPGISPAIAFAFLLLFVAYGLLQHNPTRQLARLLILLVVVGTTLSLAEATFNINLRVNRLFLLNALAQAPTFFSLSTAFALIILSAALLIPQTNLPNRWKWSQLLLLMVVITTGIAALGYLYNVKEFYSAPVGAPISLTAALMALLIAVAAIYASRHEGLVKILTSPTSGGVMMRRILPFVIVVPHIVGLVFVHLAQANHYFVASGTAASVIICEVLLIGALWKTSYNIDGNEKEREQFAQILRESEARFRTLFEQSSDTILLSDDDGRFVDANPQAEKLTGYTHDELLRLSVADIAATHTRQQADAHYQRLRRAGRLNGEYHLKRKDGQEVMVEYTATRIAPGVYQSVLHDISPYKQVEENLRHALEKEHELNEMKSRFVSMVSHEFRTPLSIIRTSSDILSRYIDRLNEAQRQDYIGNVQSQVTHMVQLLEDVLTVSKAASVGVDFTPEMTELNGFCQQIVAEFQLTTSSHQIVFTSSHESISAHIDRKLLRQALTNLLSNALKYSPQAQRINVDLDFAQDQLCLQVQDFGIGIPSEDHERLFQHFHRAHNVGSISGTGLGLSIVKDAVEAHSGRISFSCEEGTTFTITLPYRSITEHKVEPVHA